MSIKKRKNYGNLSKGNRSHLERKVTDYNLLVNDDYTLL